MLLSLFLFKGCGDNNGSTNKTSNNDSRVNEKPSNPLVYTYEVVATYPHDPNAFTQGLQYRDGYLYESTGEQGNSSVRKVEIKTGKIIKKINLDESFFGEGLTILNDKIYQITWQNQKGFIYDLNSFNKTGEFTYSGEGWGLTNDGKQLILTDGTNLIKFLDPNTFQTVNSVSVVNNGQPVNQLNELEYIKGEIWSNIWHNDNIVRIDPATGKILGWVDLSRLRPRETLTDTEGVLNGIAYDEQSDRLFVTGKRWPKVFEIRLKPR